MSEALPAFDLFIGVGHPLRRDDGVGPWLADRLSEGGCRAVVHAGDGTGLIARFAEARRILVADAMQGGRPPGTAIWVDASGTRLRKDAFRNSTHEFGLAYAVETGRLLGLLPDSLWIVGIEGRDFDFGEGLSPPVAETVSTLLPRLQSAFGPQETTP